MIYVAAAALADSLSPNEIAEGLIYPRLMRIREISAQLAADVSVQAVKEGLAENEDVIKLVNKGDLEGLLKYIRESMYEPHCGFLAGSWLGLVDSDVAFLQTSLCERSVPLHERED